MNIGNVGTTGFGYNMYSAATTKAESNKTFKMGSAAREETVGGDGKNIGVMTIGNQAYLAQYSENSTPANPIVKVGDYEVSVNDVDPENATEIEMFALMSHLDKTGQSQNEGMSSFSKMRTYSQQAEQNGFCNGIAGANEAWNSKRNWTEIVENARQTYSQSLIPEVYALTRKCDNLLDVMQKWIENRKIENVDDNFIPACAMQYKANVSSYFEEADWISNSPAEQAFRNVAPNAPDSVKKAWMEAAEESGANGMGIMDNGMMSHISQLMVMQVVRRERGEENWSDVLGNSVGSALAAAKQALYQLENPLVPHSTRGAKVQEAIAQEKEFYISFIKKLEALQETTGSDNTTNNESGDTAESLDYAQAIREKIEEIYEKVVNGDTEQSFSIGSQSFTIEEWDKLLAKFDKALEEIQKAQEEEFEKRTEENEDKVTKTVTEETNVLTAEELQGFVDEQIKSNQSKKLTLEEMIERSYVNARNMKFSFTRWYSWESGINNKFGNYVPRYE